MDADVIVVGAGMAGLTAARDLRAAGLRVLVLEARERIGGRVCTVRDSSMPVPVELGASFIHEGAPRTLTLARDLGFALNELDGEHLARQNGRLDPNVAFEERVARALEAAFAMGKEKDLPIGEALDRADLAPFDRALARSFIEGFHAADLVTASTRALARSGAGAGRLLRIDAGYGALAARLASELAPAVLLRRRVVRIAHRPDDVRVTSVGPTGRDREHRARGIVIAVPLSAMKEGAIAFDPPLPEDHRRALDHLAMGHVVKVTLGFREPFWIDADKIDADAEALAGAAFLHDPGAPFPIFWSQRPKLAPVLVAWAGGSAAAALEGSSPARLAAIAVDTLAQLVGAKPALAHDALQTYFVHDWSNDPFSRGAYSYVLAFGEDAPGTLARPLAPNVVMAGEHTEPPPHGATVEGALASGDRAARALLSELA